MVVGNGMLAKAFSGFSARQDIVIFASGVSDSNERDSAQFDREKALLSDVRRRFADQLIVYFGTCSMEDPDRCHTPYVQHKLEAESILESDGRPWLVLRLPLVIGPRHESNTLGEFLFRKISAGEPFEVWRDAIRYPLDVSDAVRAGEVFAAMPQYWNRRINVALQSYPVLDFVRIFEDILQKRAIYSVSARGGPMISCPELESELQRSA